MSQYKKLTKAQMKILEKAHQVLQCIDTPKVKKEKIVKERSEEEIQVQKDKMQKCREILIKKREELTKLGKEENNLDITDKKTQILRNKVLVQRAQEIAEQIRRLGE